MPANGKECRFLFYPRKGLGLCPKCTASNVALYCVLCGWASGIGALFPPMHKVLVYG
ncbi:predicted protein [Plenodomus lingam JN3]|uniref:Uncharacterized protein n=1 Tax=Leptosphaeria maculans (strain JN3 / isolate v23.1.3 / race Av1-4-5-6-7-8) TaxID=985895 RepID=E5A746_LEPMJ|nr:predicted protein [Plenodomus lingam JN3]CBX99441.1 predicted protein [Plenodomus lingam JN3]